MPGLSCGVRDLCCGVRGLRCGRHAGSSSPNRDRTQAPCIGSVESYPPTTREVPEAHASYLPKWREQCPLASTEVEDYTCQRLVSCMNLVCVQLTTPALLISSASLQTLSPASLPSQSKSGWSLPQGLCTCRLSPRSWPDGPISDHLI